MVNMSNKVIPYGSPYPIQLRSDARNQIFKFQGTQVFTWATTSNISTTATGNYFTFGGLNISSTLATVFDQYRITRIQAYLQPAFTQINESTPEQALWTSAVDIDNSTAPANFSATCAKPGALVSSVACGHYHSWVPNAALDVYNGAFTGFANAEGLWIDCSNTNVQYYGLKTFADITTVAFAIKAICTYDVEFRGISTA